MLRPIHSPPLEKTGSKDAATARTTVWTRFSLWDLRVDRRRLEGFGKQ